MSLSLRWVQKAQHTARSQAHHHFATAPTSERSGGLITKRARETFMHGSVHVQICQDLRESA